MKSAIAGVIGLALSAAVAPAQPAPLLEQETARARQLLQSSAWADKAWGVYFAGRLHSEDLTAPLLEQFRAASGLSYSPSHTAEYAFVASLFDAAIEAEIAVPADLLQPFEETWSEPVLILLARGGNEDSLLRLADGKRRDMVWLTANNLLLERKSQRWYATTLTELSITHRFRVTDPDNVSGEGMDGGSAYCGDGIAVMPRGFPPIAIYALQQARQGRILLARGPEDVYYSRTVVPADKQVGSGSCGSPIDRRSIRIGYLAEIGSLSHDEASRLFRPETSIRYSDAEAFQREVEKSLQAQEQGIREVLRGAKTRGFDPGGVTLQIVPEVVDRRTKTSGPLPAIAPREIAPE
jgi:hypothetical protein